MYDLLEASKRGNNCIGLFSYFRQNLDLYALKFGAWKFRASVCVPVKLDISNVHPYNTRSSAKHNFYTQSSRLSIQLNSFSRIGTKIWNEMPLSLRNLSKHDFKRKIKEYFLIFCLLKTPILTYEISFKRSNFLAFNVFS